MESTGWVTMWNAVGGFGYIENDQEEVFFMREEVQGEIGDSYKRMKNRGKSLKVEYSAKVKQDGGLIATEVRALNG